MTDLLEVVSLSKAYLGVKAVDDVSFGVKAGEVLGLIGPNGSGKTTMFDCLTGVQAPDAGTVRFLGRDVTTAPPHRIALLGLSRTFQLTHVFSEFSVLDNLALASQQHQEDSILGRLLRSRYMQKLEKEARERSLELLEMVGIPEKADARAGTLSYGQQKLLAFAMAVAAQPKLVCLDEPASGINPRFIERLADAVRALNRDGVTFLVAEHNLELIVELSSRVLVLAEGRLIADGPPGVVREDPAVAEAYLGGPAGA